VKYLLHNCFMFKYSTTEAVNQITARQTLQLHKHGVIKVCSIEYLTTQTELVLPTFKSWTIHKDYCLVFKISITVQYLTFLTHPVILHNKPLL